MGNCLPKIGKGEEKPKPTNGAKVGAHGKNKEGAQDQCLIADAP